jgi:FtsH-binding integral membrane protein
MQDNRFMNTAAATAAQTDVGLRAYMLGVYNHMTTALLLTGFFCLCNKMGRAECCWPWSASIWHTIEMGHYAGTAWHGDLVISAD